VHTARRRRTLGGWAVLLALALVASACGQIYPSREPAAGPPNGVKPAVQDVRIGFAQQQLQAPYFSAMQVRAEEIAAEQGFTLLFQSANKDPVIQMNQMQAMISQGIDALVVNATSVKGQTEMMTQIASQVPVIYIDTSVPDTGTTSVQSDNLTIGELSGEITAKRFLGMGKPEIKMVILTGPATDEFVGPARRQGFLNGLEKGGLKYEIRAEQPGDYAQDKGQVAAENMLAGNPDIDLIMGLNDSMTLGGYNVVKSNPAYDNVMVAAAADGQKEALALIKEGGCTGRYISTGLNSPSLAAEDALKIAVDLSTGKTKPADYPKESFTKAVGIGCENIDEYYDPNSVF
jgi:ribose transport system substrate-binding protein